MVAGAASADAVDRARRLPDLAVGLHLAMVEARPLLPPERIPLLVDAGGLLRRDLGRFGAEIALTGAVRRQLADEITAQFRAYRETGLALGHVDAHKHFHLHPVVAGMVLEIGRRFGMRALRVPWEDGAILRRVEPGASTPLTERLLARALRRRAKAAGISVADRVFGLAWSGRMTRRRLAGLLDALPDGVTEVFTHPAVDGGFPLHVREACYAEELAGLTAAENADRLRAQGIRPTGYAAAFA